MTSTDLQRKRRHAAGPSRPAAPQHVPMGAWRRYRRGRNWALAGVVVIAGAIIAYVVATAMLGLGRASLESYVVNDLTPLIEESNDLGDELAKLITRPEEHHDDADLQRTLDGWTHDGALLVERAEELDSPDELDVQTAQLVSVLTLRSAAFDAYSRSIGEATGEIDDPAPLVEIFADANRDFLAGDQLYALFEERTIAILTDAGLAEVELPKSVYFPVPESGEEPATEAFARSLFDSEAVVGSHDMRLVSVSFEPEPTAFDDNVHTIVAGGKRFELSAMIKNDGDRTEESVAVKVTLNKSGAPAADQQVATAEVQDLDPGASRTITVTDLEPVEGLNRVEVSVGPVADEAEASDNYESVMIDYAA